MVNTETEKKKAVNKLQNKNKRSESFKTVQYNRNLPKADQDMIRLDRYERQMLDKDD